MTTPQKIKEYLKLPWTYIIEISQDNQGKKIYVIRVNELPDVCTDATSVDEGMVLIQEAMELAFQIYREAGEEIPKP